MRKARDERTDFLACQWCMEDARQIQPGDRTLSRATFPRCFVLALFSPRYQRVRAVVVSRFAGPSHTQFTASISDRTFSTPLGWWCYVEVSRMVCGLPTATTDRPNDHLEVRQPIRYPYR